MWIKPTPQAVISAVPTRSLGEQKNAEVANGTDEACELRLQVEASSGSAAAKHNVIETQKYHPNVLLFPISKSNDNFDSVITGNSSNRGFSSDEADHRRTAKFLIQKQHFS